MRFTRYCGFKIKKKKIVEEKEETEVPVVSSKEGKSFMTGLRKCSEQSQMDDEKWNAIFKAMNTFDNVVDQIAAENI